MKENRATHLTLCGGSRGQLLSTYTQSYCTIETITFILLHSSATPLVCCRPVDNHLVFMVGSLAKTLGDMKHDLDVSASHSQHEDHQISQEAGGSWQGNIVDVDGFD